MAPIQRSSESIHSFIHSSIHWCLRTFESFQTTTTAAQEPSIKMMKPPTNLSSNQNHRGANTATAVPVLLPKVTKVQQPNTKTKIPDSVIDSALLAALRDPRERLGLLKLEQVMLDFIQKQPQDQYLDVGGAYNSVVTSPSLGMLSQPSMQNAHKAQTTFQRCILHRLADRFHIARDSNIDGSIRLLKSAESQVPGRLLLNVQPAEYSLTDQSDPSMLANNNSIVANNSGFGNNTSGNITSSQGKKNRKMKIMKRSNSSPASALNKNKDAGKKRTSISDKEKAYAEARARIMGTAENTADQAQESNATMNAPLHNSLSDPTLPTARGGTTYYTTTTTTKTPAASLEDSAKQNSNYYNTKATFRDRRQEETDPDFQRGGRMAMHNPYATTTVAPADYYNNPTNDYYGYSNPPPSQQQQQQQQQRMMGYGTGYPPTHPTAPQYGYAAAATPEWAPTAQPTQGRAASQTPPANLKSLEEFPSLR